MPTDAIRADPEIGGRNFDGAVAAARSTLKRFGSSELVSMLEVTGHGSNPAVIRFLARIGKALG